MDVNMDTDMGNQKVGDDKERQIQAKVAEINIEPHVWKNSSYIVFSKYYKYAEVDSTIYEGEGYLRCELINWLASQSVLTEEEDAYTESDWDSISTEYLIARVLEESGKILNREEGWGICTIVEVDKVTNSWNLGHSGRGW